MFCNFIEGEMNEAENRTKNPKQAQGARYAVLMKYLYPDDPSRRFRQVGGASQSRNDLVGGAGESFFSERVGDRVDV